MARKAGPGRPRKPVALKIQEGTYREDRDGPLDQQVRAGGVPVQPEHLQGEAKAFWESVVPGLVASGVAVACDATELGMMCEWYARYRKIGAELDAQPIDSKRLNLLIYGAGVSWTNFNNIAARFGLTPSDRAKLRVQPAGGASKTPVAARKRG